MNMEQKLAAIAAYANAIGIEATVVKADGKDFVVDMVEVMIKSRHNGSTSPYYVLTMHGLLIAAHGKHEDGTEI